MNFEFYFWGGRGGIMEKFLTGSNTTIWDEGSFPFKGEGEGGFVTGV